MWNKCFPNRKNEIITPNPQVLSFSKYTHLLHYMKMSQLILLKPIQGDVGILVLTKAEYENLLKRVQDKLGGTQKQSSARFELPVVDVMWEGQKTFLRNFSEFPKVLRRDPDKVLQYLSKEFAVPAERLGDKAMFIGKRDPDDFTRLFQIYVKDYLECPTCKSPDTKILKEKRISFLLCEACGAKSTLKGKYA